MPDRNNAKTPKPAQDIADKCQRSKRSGMRRYRFCVSLPCHEVIINHEVAIDLFWVEGNAALHIAYTQTGTQNVALPKSLSAQNIRYALIEALVTV